MGEQAVASIAEADHNTVANLVADILARIKQRGITAAEVGAGMHSGLAATVRLGKVEKVEFDRDKSIGITIFNGQAKGSVSTTDISPAAIEQAIDAALRIAKYTEADPFAGLAAEADLAKTIPDCDLYHPTEITAELAIAKAKACEQAMLEYDVKISKSDGATVSTSVNHSCYGNTLGFIGAYSTTRYSMYTVGIAEGATGMVRNHDYTVAREFDALLSPSEVGISAAKRTLAQLDAQKIKTCQVPVIFAAEEARSLLGYLLGAISGGRIYRKASFLLDKVGEPIFPDFINICERPHILKGLGSAPFDSDGVATYDKDIIQAGVLQTYLMGVYSARRLKARSTGNASGAHNVRVAPGSQTLPQLLQQMQRGLLVTDTMGHGVNSVTGDYSKGAKGFWVEGGEIQYPVHEITIAGNLKDMYQQIQAVGSDVDTRGSLHTGSVLLGQMSIAGV